MAAGQAEGSSQAAVTRCTSWLANVMHSAGLDGSFTLLVEGDRPVGMSRRRVLEQVSRSPFLLNVMGFLDDEEILAAAPRRVFLDIDPGFGQMWKELALADPFRGHDDFVTIAENIGQPGCVVPTCGLPWITTRPPVDLERWCSVNGGERFTTIASWRGPYGPVEYRGRSYGLRVHEFRKFAQLPRLVPGRFEVALEIDGSDHRDVELLEGGGWSLVDPALAAGSTDRYMRYIQGSKAELMIAKEMYVKTQSGWFSDRSACYLASGKPVLAQDTGFTRNYPVGQGLLSFQDVEQAGEGAREICRDQRRHAKAAREIAEEYFDARKVLGQLLAELGVG
ncbi:MAG: hypothetical protein AABM42_04745 [Actinomycetota bacterium]